MNRPGGEPDHLPLRPLSARLQSSWCRKGGYCRVCGSEKRTPHPSQYTLSPSIFVLSLIASDLGQYLLPPRLVLVFGDQIFRPEFCQLLESVIHGRRPLAGSLRLCGPRPRQRLIQRLAEEARQRALVGGFDVALTKPLAVDLLRPLRLSSNPPLAYMQRHLARSLLKASVT
jgi:hypothetical protein